MTRGGVQTVAWQHNAGSLSTRCTIRHSLLGTSSAIPGVIRMAVCLEPLQPDGLELAMEIRAIAAPTDDFLTRTSSPQPVPVLRRLSEALGRACRRREPYRRCRSCSWSRTSLIFTSWRR